jgi:hypothetical protein
VAAVYCKIHVRLFRQIHLAQDRLVTRVTTQVCNQIVGLDPGETAITLDDCALEPLKCRIDFAAVRVRFGNLIRALVVGIRELRRGGRSNT